MRRNRAWDPEEGSSSDSDDDSFMPYMSTCYHAEQYVEKVIKDAIFCVTGERLGEHTLDTYIEHLAMSLDVDTESEEFDRIFNICKEFRTHYNDFRYPTRWNAENPITRETAKEYVRKSKEVVDWIGGLEILDGVSYRDSWSVRRGIRPRVRIIADTPGYCRIVSEYSKIFRIRCGRRACAF